MTETTLNVVFAHLQEQQLKQLRHSQRRRVVSPLTSIARK
jgi:hypothetical protein